jgi:hypothetical protein
MFRIYNERDRRAEAASDSLAWLVTKFGDGSLDAAVSKKYRVEQKSEGSDKWVTIMSVVVRAKTEAELNRRTTSW